MAAEPETAQSAESDSDQANLDFMKSESETHLSSAPHGRSGSWWAPH